MTDKFILSDHPLEQVLDIEENTTHVPAPIQRTTTLAPVESYDDKDTEIEEQFQEVYDAAMDAYESQMSTTANIDPKFRARGQEVAVQFLNAALNAAREKASLKQNKEKIVQKATSSKTVNNNLIVADRNELLKEILNQPSEMDITPDKE